MHIVNAFKEAQKRAEAVAQKIHAEAVELMEAGDLEGAKAKMQFSNEIRKILEPFTE